VSRDDSRFQRYFDRLTSKYGQALAWSLRRRWWTLAAFLLALLAAISLAGRLGTEFLPQMDDGRVMVKVKLPAGTALAETDRILADIEGRIGEDPRIASLFALAGGKVMGLYTYEIANEGELNIQLVPRRDRDVSTREFVASLRPIVAQVPAPGGNAMASQMKVKGIRKLGESDIEVKLTGQDIAPLYALMFPWI
jgi:multidrug efflux pump subunit AcrB